MKKFFMLCLRNLVFLTEILSAKYMNSQSQMCFINLKYHGLLLFLSFETESYSQVALNLLCSPGCLQTCDPLPQPLKCWAYRNVPPLLVPSVAFKLHWCLHWWCIIGRGKYRHWDLSRNYGSASKIVASIIELFIQHQQPSFT